MEAVLIVLIPGLIGGAMLALTLGNLKRRSPATIVPRPLAAPSPAMLNMAHIKVDGVGGLGMIAVVVVVAAADPAIRLVTIVALVLGAGLAIALVALRRSASDRSGSGPDDRSILGLESAHRNAAAPTDDRVGTRGSGLGARRLGLGDCWL